MKKHPMALTENERLHNRHAFISDIHGNSPALRAVLRDIERRGVGSVYNLGDSLFGPLDPHGTFDLLTAGHIIHLRGNGDRELLAADDGSSTTMNKLRRDLSSTERRWLEELPPAIETEDFFLCHGSPGSDEQYLLEDVSGSEPRLRPLEEIEGLASGIKARVVVCGHSHLPRLVGLSGGRLAANAGSVGLPAYADDLPVKHKMESGTPQAKYLILEKTSGGWSAEIIHLAYDWPAATALALAGGRRDWAAWLATGFAAG